MGGNTKNKKRIANIGPGPVLTARTQREDACLSGKAKYANVEEAPTNMRDGRPLRWYECDLCGWMHVTSKGTLKWGRPERGSVRPGQGLARR